MTLEEFTARIVKAIQHTGTDALCWTSYGVVDTADRRFHTKGDQDPIGMALVYWDVAPIPHFPAVYALCKAWGVGMEQVTEFREGMKHPGAEEVSDWMLEGQKIRRRYRNPSL